MNARTIRGSVTRQKTKDFLQVQRWRKPVRPIWTGFQKEGIPMRAIRVMILLSLVAGTLLSGCIIVPAGGWQGHGRGWHHPRYYSPYQYGHGR